ncbi:uncharacterized protein MELLADRAFT_101649 [Melampsora larici-populina 98AG31]|uniref:Uncharacterized protein n=1 Tax=Melampsora larici-populina (strain 98AG31 / pathotype 3-4-7) TaxID=747676 RepID=F4R6I6_MELLP|nr:uncharacterized protein MELLADRAFT_101649 [Melampsora larici-populina 98AG31]EGG11888.1 hypothetical protein MELLADRAFT_101649 [Melampsora larici-populina 98AG31]
MKAKLDTKHRYWTLSHINTSHNHPPNFDLEYIPPDDKSSNSTGDKIDTFLYFLSQRLQLLDSTTQNTVLDEIKRIVEKQDEISQSLIQPLTSKVVVEFQGTKSTHQANSTLLDIEDEESDHPQSPKLQSLPHASSNAEPPNPMLPVHLEEENHPADSDNTPPDLFDNSPTGLLNSTTSDMDITPNGVANNPATTNTPNDLNNTPSAVLTDKLADLCHDDKPKDGTPQLPSGSSAKDIQPPKTHTDLTKGTQNTTKKTCSLIPVSTLEQRPHTRKRVREQVQDCPKAVTRTRKLKQ